MIGASAIAGGGPVAPSPYLIHDTFTVAADTNLVNHLPGPVGVSPGVLYTADSVGAAVPQCKQATGVCQQTAAGFRGLCVDAGVGNKNKTQKIKLNLTGTTGIVGAGVLCRADAVDPASAVYVMVDVGLGTDEVKIWDWATASLKAIATLSSTYQGTDVTLVVTDDGTDIWAYIEEEPTVIASTQTDHPSQNGAPYTPPGANSTIYGVYFETTNAADLRIDDWRVYK